MLTLSIKELKEALEKQESASKKEAQSNVFYDQLQKSMAKNNHLAQASSFIYKQQERMRLQQPW